VLQSPEFKPQYHKKKKKGNYNVIIGENIQIVSRRICGLLTHKEFQNSSCREWLNQSWDVGSMHHILQEQ
jgi:hypothetical protein